MEGRPLYLLSFGLATTVSMLLLLRIGQRIFAKSSASSVMTEKNSARRFLQVGQVLAVFLIAASATKNVVDGSGIGRDAAWVSAFAVLGLVLLAASGHFGLSLLLRSKLPAEIERGNTAAGVAAGCHYVATGIITARAMAGHDVKSLGLSLAFFAIGQVTLHLFVTLFRVLTVYDDSEQIRGENLAAALSYGGVAIAVALLIARALEGDFTAWGPSLKGYGFAMVFALALYPVRQILVQSVFLGFPFALRGGQLDRGISVDRNEGMGVLEAVTYLATALAISHLA